MNWYAVNTKPYHEFHAERNLQQLGLATFCPQLTRERVVRRKWRTVTVPLFPGYLFATLDVAEQFRAVTYARGVRRIVAFGGTPARVEQEFIDAIRSRVERGHGMRPEPDFTPGGVVRIIEGPLRGLEAVFEREMSDHHRAVLLLRVLAGQARVVLPIEHVVNL